MAALQCPRGLRNIHTLLGALTGWPMLGELNVGNTGNSTFRYSKDLGN